MTVDKAQTPIYIVTPNDPTGGATVTRDATHAAATALIWREGCRLMIVDPVTLAWNEVGVSAPEEWNDAEHASRTRDELARQLISGVAKADEGKPPLATPRH